MRPERGASRVCLRNSGGERTVLIGDSRGRLQWFGHRVQLWGGLVHGRGVGHSGRLRGRWFGRLCFAPWHLGAGVQVSQEAAVGPQLGATALTQEVYVWFVVMPHVFHQLLHVGEGAGAVGHGAHHDLPGQRLSRDLMVLDVALQLAAVGVGSFTAV